MSIIVLSVTILLIEVPIEEFSYYSAMDDKIKRLEQIQSPKLILVGGSNLTFGIDSKRIENEFNLPVVNMSLHAGLGLDYMLNQINNRIKKGDIVLISPEYYYFDNTYNGEGVAIYGYILDNKNSIFDFSPTILFQHINALGPVLFTQYINTLGPVLFPQYINARNNASYGIYTKTNFNEYGDMVGHLNLDHEVFSHGVKNNTRDCTISYRQIEYINKFINYADGLGVKIYISFPAISETSYNNDKTCNDKIVDIIKLKYKNITISDHERYILRDSLFFNTYYHLDNIGRSLRTDYLINDLSHVILKNGTMKLN